MREIIRTARRFAKFYETTIIGYYMRGLHHLIQGFCLPYRGGKILRTARGVKRWAIAPLLVGVFFYAVALALFIYLMAYYRFAEFTWDFWGEWGARLAMWTNTTGAILQWLLVLPLFLFISYFTFTFCVSIFASPLNDILSEKIEIYLTGKKPAPTDLRLTLKSMGRSLTSTLRFSARQFFYMILTLPLLFIPLVGQLAWFGLNAYFIGISFFDVALARNFFSHAQKKILIRENRARLIGMGSALSLLFMIPFVGCLIIPLGVAGGTILYCELNSLAKKIS